MANKEWTMPSWMVKYSRVIGGEHYGTQAQIEEIKNSNNPEGAVMTLIRVGINAKIELLTHLESKRII